MTLGKPFTRNKTEYYSKYLVNLKNGKIEKEFFDISLFYTDDTLKDIMQKEYLRVYEQAMYKISELDRNLIKYKYELEFSNKEIADVCDLKVSHVSTYINRAMAKLRRAMKEVENE